MSFGPSGAAISPLDTDPYGSVRSVRDPASTNRDEIDDEEMLATDPEATLLFLGE